MEKAKEIEERLLDRIMKLSEIKERKAVLSREEQSLSEPPMSDLTMIGNIFDMFMDYCDGVKKQLLFRKMFIFIILYFYSPSALAGSKMRRGLRERIAAVLGCTSSNISHDYKNVSFYYMTYRSFRQHVNCAIAHVKELLAD